ncbi:MAG: HAD-IIIC family phosphatase, partial [Candidatus Sigynarchaeota archaeon]
MNKVFNTIGKELKFPLVKIAILRTFTIEQIIPYLRVACFLKKFQPEIFIGGYNQIDQEILNPSSNLYRFNPDFLIIAARAEERCPKLTNDFIMLGIEDVKKEIESILNQTENLVQEFRLHSRAKVILHNYEIPEILAYGIYDIHSEPSQKRAFISLNEGLLRIAKKFNDVFVLDYDHLTARFGKKNWFDEKLWYTARAPISNVGLAALANEYLRFLIATEGRTRKCIVVDLDNTLWGGVVGEIGWNEIQIGETYPGNAYLDFQKELLKLYHKGIVLAINIKNNEADVMEVFDKRDEMVLKKKHFACMKINWENKAKNMGEIAKELNLGLDSFVFLDDNPVERELIRQYYPDVLVVELPENPQLYARIV